MKTARRIELKEELPSYMREDLAAFAHDLRTPMTCVQGAAQMALFAGRQGKDVSAQLEQILLAVHAMDRMLAQLCDAQGAGEESLFTAGMLCRELQTMMGARAAKKAQQLSIDLSALNGLTFCADYAALSRVLINLLSNSVKYTPEGGSITLRAELTHDGRLRFVVADNGMGIKRTFLRRAFVPFARAQESAHLPGKGLGLAIVRELVARMGGRIRVKSEWGRGTLFVVTVPVRVVPGGQGGAPAAAVKAN